MTPLEWIETLFYSVQPHIYWTCGLCISLITVLEWFFFAFHPLEKNIFLDQGLRQESESQRAPDKRSN